MRTLYESILGGLDGIESGIETGLAETMVEWLKNQPHFGAYPYSFTGSRWASDKNHIRIENNKISCDELAFESIPEFPDWIKFKNVDILTTHGVSGTEFKFPSIEHLKKFQIKHSQINGIKSAFKSIDEIDKITVVSNRDYKLQFPNYHIKSVIEMSFNILNEVAPINNVITNLDSNGLIFPVGNLTSFGIKSPKKINSVPEFSDFNLFKSIMDEFFHNNKVENVILTTHSLYTKGNMPYGYYIDKDKTGDYTLKLVLISQSVHKLNTNRKP